MSEHVKSFIDKLSLGQAAEAGESFKDALKDKIASALETRRKELASTLFNIPTEAEPFSDPKPVIASPEPTTVVKDEKKS